MKKIAKIAVALAVALSLVFCFAACDEEPAATETKTVSSVAVTAQPTKTAYLTGETFDPSGAKITVTYSDETTAVADVTAAMCSAVDMTTAGEKTVTVTYTEGEVSKTATFKVTVAARAAFAETAVRWNGAGHAMFTVSFKVTADVTFDNWGIKMESAEDWANVVALYETVVTGTEAEAKEAAAKIGTDVFIAVYGKNGEEKILLTSKTSGNPVLKNKGWSGWLNTSANEKWYPNGSDKTYVGATMPKNTEFMTSVSGIDDTKYNWAEITATGKLYVDFIVIQNGNITVQTASVDF